MAKKVMEFERNQFGATLFPEQQRGKGPKGMQEMAVMRRAKECRKEVGCGQGHRNKGGRFLTI